MFSIIVANVTGVIMGVVSSIVAWWVLFHVLAPKISFSDSLAKDTNPIKDGNCEYIFKYENLRSRRALNIELSAYVFLPDFPVKGHNNIPQIPLTKTRELAMFPTTDVDKVRRTVGLKIHEEPFISFFKHELIDSEIRLLAHDKKLTLEQILSLSEGSYIRVIANATDSITGAIKSFKSKDYKLSDIKPGRFIRKSMEIGPADRA